MARYGPGAGVGDDTRTRPDCQRLPPAFDPRNCPDPCGGSTVKFAAATAGYESWLRQHCEVYGPDLAHKSVEMAASAFAFHRGTYYRWAQTWVKRVPAVVDAPRVLAVGDLHVENFGTWRDSDGRLVWGVNDFDEVDELPYTNDLLRIATSLRLAKLDSVPDMKFSKACRWIADGYRSHLESGGEPIVLEERHPALRALAMAEDREPAKFWNKYEGLIDKPAVDPPADAKLAMQESLPAGKLELAYRRREKAGVGSLGKPRFLLLAKWAGSWIAREAKAVTPPATAWVEGVERPSRIGELLGRAVRCPDPIYRVSKNWLVRRLAPRTSRIELNDLKKLADVRELLSAMGAETANVHLGTPAAKAAILADLAGRPAEWLADAADTMAGVIREEWTEWKAKAD